jgi:hypothetical protein
MAVIAVGCWVVIGSGQRSRCRHATAARTAGTTNEAIFPALEGWASKTAPTSSFSVISIETKRTGNRHHDRSEQQDRTRRARRRFKRVASAGIFDSGAQDFGTKRRGRSPTTDERGDVLDNPPCWVDFFKEHSERKQPYGHQVCKQRRRLRRAASANLTGTRGIPSS